MDYTKYTKEELVQIISDLEILNDELLMKKNSRVASLHFADGLGDWYWDIKENTIVFNSSKLPTLGYTKKNAPKSLAMQDFFEYIHPADLPVKQTEMERLLQGQDELYEMEYRIRAKDCSWRWVYAYGKVTKRDSNGKPEYVTGLMIDITEKKELEQKLKKQNASIYIDSVTHCATVNTFKCKAGRLLEKKENRYAYIVLDIARFKCINEIFGIEQGNRLLKHIADVLSRHTGGDEAFARVIGDIFHIMLVYTGKSTLESRLKSITRDIEAFAFDKDIRYNLLVSEGIYIINDDEPVLENISDRASLAANMTKGKYESTYCYYSDSILSQIIDDSEIESDMQDALQNREFQVYLQPKYHFKTGKLSGAEALIRWVHPEKGIIMPGRFIPLFEKNGFIKKIDLYVFEDICRLQREWVKNGDGLLRISVNQSRLSLFDKKHVEKLKAIVEKYAVDPKTIELEITENVLSGNFADILNLTKNLHEYGFKVSIDDFGSGYSSLNILKDMYVDVVKLDREFIHEPSDKVRCNKIIKNVIWMLKDLGIQSVAEGVETKEQVAFLRGAGCDLAQGYYYAKPMPVERFRGFVAQAL